MTVKSIAAIAEAQGAAGAASGQRSWSVPPGPTFEAFLSAAERGAEGAGRGPLLLSGPGGERSLVSRPPEVDAGEAAPPATSFLDGAEESFVQLEKLLGELESARPYSPQELLRMQLEIHKITLQIETTTKGVSEVVNGAKQLFQQQI
ncbi:MAG: hypothetical protein AAF604_10005 [Acidobacteriota bacterium]